MTVFIVCEFAVLVACGLVALRANSVANFRSSIIDDIYSAGKADIKKDKSPSWRWDEYHKVSFNDMMTRFWLPLEPENWWEDTRFLKR